MVQLNYIEKEESMASVLINLIGSPSVGKSTLAGRLFAKLKDMELNADISPEYVKQWVYRGQNVRPYDQMYIFGKEVYRQSQLFNSVDIIISDSPVLLTAFYHLYVNGDNALREVCKDFYDMAERLDGVKVLNFFLTRKKKYQDVGRFHSKEQADEIESLLRCFLRVENYPYIELDCPDEERVDVIMQHLREATNDFEGMKNE